MKQLVYLKTEIQIEIFQYPEPDRTSQLGTLLVLDLLISFILNLCLPINLWNECKSTGREVLISIHAFALLDGYVPHCKLANGHGVFTWAS